jgi:excisionase family DNA binding protein
MTVRLPDDLITQAEAARVRGVSSEAIGKLIKRGRLKAYTVAGNKLLSRREVENFKKLPAGRPSTKKGKGKGK